MRAKLSQVSILALVLGLGLTACEPEYCSGTSCVCPANTTCSFHACDPKTQSCQLRCEAGSTCDGTCGPGCNVQCEGKSCTVEAGEGSDILCSAGTCNVTCTGTCRVAGSGATVTCKNGAQSAAGCGGAGDPGTGGLPGGTGELPGGTGGLPGGTGGELPGGELP